MVAQNIVLTNGVIHVFQFVEGIWLHRKNLQVRFFLSSKKTVQYLMKLLLDGNPEHVALVFRKTGHFL